MFDLIKKLTGAFGVSGNEEEIRETIIELIKDKVDDYYVDALGNLIAVKRGKGKKVMIAAHMDEIGVIATYIDEKGFLRFSNMGGVSPFFALGQRVRFRNGTIGIVSHEEKLEDMKNLKLSNMFIDIGAASRQEAEKKVCIGDTASFVGEAIQSGDRIISKALDDRCGCAILVKTLQELPSTSNQLYFVFTVQEELGLRGAKTAAFGILPELALAVDVTLTGDKPECPPMEVKLGLGPAVKIKDNSIICHPEVRTLLIERARKLGIPYQLEILERGGNDSGAIHMTAGGVPSGTISIPSRYTHSPSEMVSISDLENAVKLLKAAII